MTFSGRCKWLLISTIDGCLRVYDLMSGLIIDWFKFDNAITSMSFTTTNAFLATTHVNTMGIHIWANKYHFIEPFLKNVGDKPILMDKVIMSEEQIKIENIKKMEQEKVAEAMKMAVVNNDDDDDDDNSRSEESSEVDLNDLLDTNYTEEDESDYEDDSDDDDIKLPNIASLYLDDDNELITMSSNPRSIWKNFSKLGFNFTKK